MTFRLEQALNKLYQAYNKDALIPNCAIQCAVGNICDNKDMWRHLTDAHGSEKLNYVGLVNESLARRINGYLPSELLKTEAIFLNACGYSLPLKHNARHRKIPISKDVLFDGLVAVIEYLCVLDGITNVMDYTSLLNYKKDISGFSPLENMPTNGCFKLPI